MNPAAVTVRRHWGAFRTPWVIRKLRKSPNTRARLPDAYVYTGPRAGAAEWTRALVAETDSFRHSPTGLEPAEPRRGRDGLDPTDLPGPAHSAGSGGRGDLTGGGHSTGGGGHPTGGGGHGGGGGGGGDWLAGADELGLIIAAAVLALIVAVIAVPLGLIAFEVVLTFGIAVVGVILRLAHLKPWTVLVSRERTVVAVLAVKGWRTSRAVLAALRAHAG